MKVKDYSYETFPRYTKDIEGALELKGNKENLRCRLRDVYYQDNCLIRFLFPNTILDEQRKYPLIIHVQGSGWYPQDMNDHIFDFLPIVKAGYIYAIVQYHGAPDFKYPTQVNDVVQAIEYLKENNQDYPIDLSSVYLSGDSSGGHIALLIALQKSYAFKGVIDLYGVTNFMTFNDWYSKYDWQEEKNVIDFLGSLDQELLIEASPMTYVKEKMNLPPFLILHGDKDHVVPITQSIELYEKLKEYHYEVTFGRVHDADHGRSIFYNEDVYQTIIAFLNKHQ